MKKKLFAVTTALLILLSGCGKKSESDYSLRDAIMKNQENGNVELIREYIENGCNPDDFEYPLWAEVIKESNPFLYTVTSTGTYTGLPYLLILEGADVNGRSTNGGSTLLMNMAYNSDYEMCQFLINEGADVNLKDDSGQTAVDSCLSDVVDYVYWNERTETLQLLLENGAEVSAKTVSSVGTRVYIQSIEAVRMLVEHCKENNIETGLSEIIEASVMGDSEKVLSLLNENLPDDVWEKLIPSALAYCNSEVIKKIVGYGYDFVNRKHSDTFPVIDYESDINIEIAARNGNIDVVKYMYENKLFPMDNSSEGLLSNCLRYDYETTQYLLSEGVSISDNISMLRYSLIDNNYELTELIISAIENEEILQMNLDSAMSDLFVHRNWFNPYKDYEYLEKCDYLFGKGASIESESFYPDIEVCKWLVEHGKTVDADVYDTASTPLCDVYQSAECIEYLIECGADINAKGVSTPLENAVKYGYYDSVVTLVENGAEIGDSIFTAVYGSEKILRYLCENGADLTLVDEEGKTLLERAETASGAHPKVSEILKEYGRNS